MNLLLDYAKTHHSFESVSKYDLNVDNLVSTVGGHYDIIMARACLMFCDDLERFATEVLEALNPGGMLIVDRSIEPTLGTMVRVQLDEYSYHVLRQPETVQRFFVDAGFRLEFRNDETDQSLYVYDHDLLPHWKWMHYLYEIKALQGMGRDRLFSLPCRDRRWTCFFFSSPMK